MAKAPQILAGALAVNRIAFGLNYLARPQMAGPSWIGRVARAPGTKVMTRAQGVRDVALGSGALCALARSESNEATIWVANLALVDAADFAATWAARKRLPRAGRKLALGGAAASSAIAAVSAAGLATSRDATAAGP